MRYKASAGAARSIWVTGRLGVHELDDFDGVFEAMDHVPERTAHPVARIFGGA